MELNSEEFASAIQEIVKQMVKKEIKSYFNNNNILISWVGKVSAVNTTNNTADILLPGQSTAITKQNKTGQALAVNDEVYLVSPTGTLSNSYIGWKKAKYA